ncbi:hypothetical protein ACCC96_08310 [Pseudomonas sp. Pseusp11]|uniref:hypothetical protein n=1 Tax=Pseudomonas sp. Pseusp11 TaxID=3243003 RepID=UPI0039B64B40
MIIRSPHYPVRVFVGEIDLFVYVCVRAGLSLLRWLAAGFRLGFALGKLGVILGLQILLNAETRYQDKGTAAETLET